MPKIDGDVLACLTRDANDAERMRRAIAEAYDTEVIRRLVRDALIRAARHRSAEVAVEYVTEAMIFHLKTLGPIHASAPEQLPPAKENAPQPQAGNALNRAGADTR